MSGSLNLVVLIGRVGRDVEVRYTQAGDPVANLSVATSERWKDKGGEKHERTEWHRVEVFGKTAQFVKDYVSKGALVSIEGSIRTDEWKDKDGKARKTTKIKANRVELLTGRTAQSDETPTQRAEAPAVDDDQDLPF